MTVTAYPLTWPANMPRNKNQQRSQFRTSLKGALNNVRSSIEAFGKDSGKKVEQIVISSNVTLGEENPRDVGVAVWFVWDGLQVCIPIDRYPKVEDNLQAIHHVIEARRTELRHGGLNIVRATFTGFQSLPAPDGTSKRPWREVLDLDGNPTAERVQAQFRSLSRKHHPDAGGSAESFHELQQARDEAIREIG